MRRARFIRHLLCAALLVAGIAGVPGGESSPADEAFAEGSAALRERRYADAIPPLERAASLRPDHVDTWFKLGIARSALQEWDAALAAYGKVVELDPSNAMAWHNEGNVSFRRSDYEKAAAGYRKALELDPQYLLAAFHYGWTLRQLGRGDEAEQVFRQCLAIPAEDPRAMRTHVDCLFGLGSMRHRAGDYAASAAMMEQVLSVHPGHPEARYYLGMAYRELGRTEDAKRQLEIHRQMLAAQRHAAPEFDQPAEP